MRKISQTFLLPILLGLTLLFLTLTPMLAQEPPPPEKGADPPAGTPEVGTSALSPSIRIERSLLAKIEPLLLKKLIQTEGSWAPFIVYLQPQADLAAATAPQIGGQANSDRLARRMAVVHSLQQVARTSQAGVLQLLGQAASGSRLSGQGIGAAEIKPFWVINAVAARGSLETVLALAARPEVATIRLDKTIRLKPLKGANKPAAGLNVQALKPHGAPQWNIIKIRANLVHDALGFNGSGKVVANIDSGVDWLHPALQASYRGYTGPGKLPVHPGNWYDATGQGTTYPVDSDGHGTHTMGTMVGQAGIGVAPDARWIAVKAFDKTGTAQNSWLHAAFQWILAPNGDPALAPDVVNNSWGNTNGFLTEFEADVEALLAADIYPVFSAGNDGPGSGTIGSPGSLDGVLSVGALTLEDEVANFSSRGPSPWGKIKPEVSAPGKEILSTLPGGIYEQFDGTSMAAPHVAGLAALLLQAKPALGNDLEALSEVLMATAIPLGSPIPNNNYGYGRVDAYNAVMAVAGVGTLSGTITRAGSNSRIANATLRITPRNGGPTILARSGANGTYLQGLATATYDVTASAFGYLPSAQLNVPVVTGTATLRNFSLAPKPIGTLTGVVRQAGSNIPLVATVSLIGTPVQTTTAANGSYSLTLPEGIYTATIVAPAHRITNVTHIVINDGGLVTKNIWLTPAPKILLVDSGRWYQDSQISYYRQALNDLLYPYDLWQITKPFATPNDIPPLETLKKYNIVIWSAPSDSPGYVGAGSILEKFLDGGGKLLLSGQDIAYYDGGGGFLGTAPYLRKYLRTLFREDNAEIENLSGIASQPFVGLSFKLNGGDGADNQISPDTIALTDQNFAAPLLAYQGGSELAGVHVDLCVPYRVIFLPFGFEGINARADRSAVMQRSLDWLRQTPAQHGLELKPGQQLKVGEFGKVVSHTVSVRNTGTTTDVFALSLSPGNPYAWPTTLISPTLSLAACQSQMVTITVQIPPAQKWHIADTFTLTAKSTTHTPTVQAVARTSKTPAPVLLVDDDRQYSFAAEFKEALAANNIPYDYWYVAKSWSGEVPSPPLSTLQMYPMTVWYTADDWFQPLTGAEEERLSAYLAGGGRLFFSGQDYIYNLPDHKPTPFAQTYLGVLAHREDISTTFITGRLTNPVGDNLGPYPLNFPAGYDNYTDALTPTASAQIATTGQIGQINGLTNAGVSPGGNHWHTLFLAYGPELLSDGDRARFLQRSVGWLSWLGRSTVVPSRSAALDGATVVYTATLINDGPQKLATAYFTATFPAELSLTAHSSGLTPNGGNLIWSGPLDRNQSRVFTYSAKIAQGLPLGTTIKQVNWLAYPDHNILFDRIATVKTNFPDLKSSTLKVTPTQGVEQNDILTYTLSLRNTGLADDPLVTITTALPHMLELIGVDPPGRGTLITKGKSLTWTTALSKGALALLTYRARISYETSTAIENVVQVEDGFDEPLRLSAYTTFKETTLYLPLIFKGKK